MKFISHALAALIASSGASAQSRLGENSWLYGGNSIACSSSTSCGAVNQANIGANSNDGDTYKYVAVSGRVSCEQKHSDCMNETDGKATRENPSDLQADAWLIGHGIETSQWRDQTCKRRARALVDERRLTQARLDEALRLALSAAEIRCRGGVVVRSGNQKR